MPPATTRAQKNPAHPKLFEEGSQIVCTSSTSPGYKIGEVYTPYKNERGWLVIDADDGFTDVCSMLVSSFKKVV